MEVIELVKIKESNNDVKKEFKVEPIKVYEISNENGVVGYGTINKDDKNLLTVFIREEYRGNGYGKKMFHTLLRTAMDMGYEDVNLMVSNGNVPMIKIINDVNGFETLKTRDFTKYIVHVGSPFDGVFDCE